jgi:hypothetical protein
MTEVKNGKVMELSTTLRNPHRIIDFIQILSELEGEKWNNKTQEKYQILLIKNRKYIPSLEGLSNKNEKILKNIEKKMTYNEARKIFYEKEYQDGAMRGRTSFSPLKELGLAYIDDNNFLCISTVAKKIINGEIEFSDFFLKWSLKWQYPNPLSFDFVKGYNIKPFIITIKFILEVNKKWSSLDNEPIGISKDELGIFVLSLIDFKELDLKVNKLIQYRL